MRRHAFGFGTAVITMVGWLISGLVFVADPRIGHAVDATFEFADTLDAKRDDWRTHDITVGDDVEVRATLSWTGNADLNLGIRDGSGTWLQWAASRNGQPETLTQRASGAGTLTLGVAARRGRAAYTLRVEVVSSPSGTGEVTPTTTTTAAAPTTTTTTAPSAPSTTIAPSTTAHSVRKYAAEQESPTHTHTREQAVAHAMRFDVISALPWSYKDHVAAMKAANPDLVLLAYFNGSMAFTTQKDAYPAAWYVYDPNGAKIQNNWGLWLMDPANGEWIETRVRECGDRVRTSGYDGCFADNLGAGTLWPASLSGTPLNPRTGRAWTNAEWLQATTQLAGRVHTALHVPIMANGLVSGMSYFDASAPSRPLGEATSDGLAESFVRTAHQGATDHRPEEAWKKDVDMLVDAAARGVRVHTLTKVWATASDAAKLAWHRYAAATFLLGDGGNHSFSFSYGKGTDNLAGDSILSSLRIGAPLGSYTSAGGGAYQRAFENGVVAVNPTSSAVTLQLAQPHVDLDGVVQSSVVLGPHSASILTRA